MHWRRARTASRPPIRTTRTLRRTTFSGAAEKRLAALDRHASVVIELSERAIDVLREQLVCADAAKRLQLGNDMASAVNRHRCSRVDGNGDVGSSLRMISRVIFVWLSGHGECSLVG